jgi:hypothetical protein
LNRCEREGGADRRRERRKRRFGRVRVGREASAEREGRRRRTGKRVEWELRARRR